MERQFEIMDLRMEVMKWKLAFVEQQPPAASVPQAIPKPKLSDQFGEDQPWPNA